MKGLLLVLALAACGDGKPRHAPRDAGGDSDTDTDTDTDTATATATDSDSDTASDTDTITDVRNFALASSGVQLQIDPLGVEIGPADLATDVDAVLVHQEFHGLPWDAFEAGDDPPAEWVAAMDGLAADAAKVGETFLSLQLVAGGGRHFLANRVVVDAGGLRTESEWSAECYDFSSAPDGSSKAAAYVAYVDWMVRRFQPRWVNLAIEMNFFMTCGDAAWDALVEVERAAYVAAKAAKPDVVAFPSIQIDVLYGWSACESGDRDACFDESYAKLADVARDRFAVTTFPYLIAPLRDQTAIDDDWFTRAGDRAGETTVIAETGWLATPMVVLQDVSCTLAIDSSAELQLAWFDRVVAAAESGGMDLVTWVTNRDFFPTLGMDDCPCDFDAAWCAALDEYRAGAGPLPSDQTSAEYAIKMFGSMGLRDHDGVARPDFLERWEAVRATPWRP